MNKFIIALLLAIFVSCSGPEVRNYWKDRGNDLADPISFSLDFSLGTQISIGPFSVGLGFSNSIIETRYGKFRVLFPILSGKTDLTIIGGYGINSEKGYMIHREGEMDSEDDYFIFRNKSSNSGTRFPKNLYGRIKVSIGLLIGFTLEINILEGIDFITGIFGYDLLDDDWNTYYRNLESQNKK